LSVKVKNKLVWRIITKIKVSNAPHVPSVQTEMLSVVKPGDLEVNFRQTEWRKQDAFRPVAFILLKQPGSSSKNAKLCLA